MRVTDLLPFISSARLVNSRYEFAKVSTLTFPVGLPMPGGLPPEESIKYFSTRAVTVYVPTDNLGFRVPDLTTREYKFLSNLPPDTTLTLKVQEVDYQDVLQGVTFDDPGGAYFDFAGVSEYEELPGPLSDALNSAVSGDYAGLGDLIRKKNVLER